MPTYQLEAGCGPTSNDIVENMFLTLPITWERWVPSKVMVFAWKILRDRYCSKENLFKPNVITDHEGTSYTFCMDHLQLTSHFL